MTSESLSTTTDSKDAVTDKRGIEQISAGALGLLVCGLVTAIIWFFAIQSLSGMDEFATGALAEKQECGAAATYGVAEQEPCATP